MTMNWKAFSLPLSKGVNTKPDKRALAAPDLAVCRDVQFVPGGLETRKPYQMMGADAIADARKVVAVGDELLLFTKDTLYTWSVRDDGWRAKGTYLAPKVEEEQVFNRASDQYDCDMAELNGVAFYVWTDAAASSGVYCAARDIATGSAVLAPTLVDAGGSIARVVALAGRLLLFWAHAPSTLNALSISPDSMETDLAVSPTVIASTMSVTDVGYDVARAGDNAILVHGNSPISTYGVKLISPSLSVGSSTKSRSCDGPIAVAVSPAGDRFQVVRAFPNITDGNAIYGDLLDAATLADVHINTIVGVTETIDPAADVHVPIDHIAAAYSSTAVGGAYRCHAWWSVDESNDNAKFEVQHNWIDTANAVGTAEQFIKRLGIASRAFSYDGHVYCWLACASVSTTADDGVLATGFRSGNQNTYLLYREDGLLVTKACPTTAGGYPSSWHLPNVQADGATFTWAGVNRRKVGLVPALSGGTVVTGRLFGYEFRTPCAITLTLDSNEVRRIGVLGKTAYCAGGMLSQYDGLALSEVGFFIYPWFVGLKKNASAGGKFHSPSPGTYSYKSTFSWRNARGELDRSTTDVIATITYASGTTSTDVTVLPCYVTNKAGIVVEVWATLINPDTEAPFFLASDIDPSNVTGPNCNVPNDATAYSLAFSDQDNDIVIRTKQASAEVGDVLENLSPPSSSIICATQDRIFLSGIPGQPDRVIYSKNRSEGNVAAFHEALSFDVPREGGDITAIALLDELLIVFRETAIYAVPGSGFDDTGNGVNYGPPRRLSGDVGAVSQEAVALSPPGLIFKSLKGWYLLGSDGQAKYIGSQVAAFDGDEVLSVHVLEAQQEIRCMTAARVLCFNYNEGQWSEWTIGNGLGATIWNGTYVYLASDGTVQMEQADYSAGVDYGIDIESAWIPLGEMQGYGALRWLSVLGELRSSCRVRVRLAYNYNESDSAGPIWLDDKYFAVTPAVTGGPLQFRHGPKFHKCESFKVRLTAYHAVNATPPTGEALKLTSLALELGFRQGLFRGLPAAQKT